MSGTKISHGKCGQNTKQNCMIARAVGLRTGTNIVLEALSLVTFTVKLYKAAENTPIWEQPPQWPDFIEWN